MTEIWVEDEHVQHRIFQDGKLKMPPELMKINPIQDHGMIIHPLVLQVGNMFIWKHPVLQQRVIYHI